MGDKPTHELSEGDHPGQTGVRLYYTAVTQATAPFEARLPQLSRWRRMQIPVIAAAVYGVVRLIGPTLRTEIVGVQNAVQIRNQGEPAHRRVLAPLHFSARCGSGEIAASWCSTP